MVKGMIIKDAKMFTSKEKSEIKKEFLEKNIDIFFRSEHEYQNSMDSFVQLLINNELLKLLAEGIAVDLLKDLIYIMVKKIKTKKFQK